jgi:hypothetical protein
MKLLKSLSTLIKRAALCLKRNNFVRCVAAVTIVAIPVSAVVLAFKVFLSMVVLSATTHMGMVIASSAMIASCLYIVFSRVNQMYPKSSVLMLFMTRVMVGFTALSITMSFIIPAAIATVGFAFSVYLAKVMI